MSPSGLAGVGMGRDAGGGDERAIVATIGGRGFVVLRPCRR